MRTESGGKENVSAVLCSAVVQASTPPSPPPLLLLPPPVMKETTKPIESLQRFKPKALRIVPPVAHRAPLVARHLHLTPTPAPLGYPLAVAQMHSPLPGTAHSEATPTSRLRRRHARSVQPLLVDNGHQVRVDEVLDFPNLAPVHLE